MNNLLIIISGPSGVGKGTVVHCLRKRNFYALSVSCTTRKPRLGEADGKDYFFISKEEFLKRIENGGFLEYNKHFENYYGTPLDFVENQLETGDVLMEIEVDGALNAKKRYPEAVLIMIVPPDKSELERRLLGRKTEDKQAIKERLARLDYELSKKEFYDYVVVNDDLTACVNEIEEIIKKEKEIKR